MKRSLFVALAISCSLSGYCWGFFAHKKINNYAVFLLPPEMLSFYKQNIDFITEHSVDPDKRRYAIADEGPRHYIDIDRYGVYPYDSLPHNWNEAVLKYTTDTLHAHGIGPWWTLTMLNRLTDAFKDRNKTRILKLSAEIGHYIADLHVPLHACGNHNGQKTNQLGIHGFWESRLPELLADNQWDFFIGRAAYAETPGVFIWNRVLESAAAADTVLKFEAELNRRYNAEQKYAYETRNGVTIRQYSSAYSIAYDKMMNGMVERRMRQSIFGVSCFWYTAWVNAGQPDLNSISALPLSDADMKEFEELNKQWQGGAVKGRSCD